MIIGKLIVIYPRVAAHNSLQCSGRRRQQCKVRYMHFVRREHANLLIAHSFYKHYTLLSWQAHQVHHQEALQFPDRHREMKRLETEACLPLHK